MTRQYMHYNRKDYKLTHNLLKACCLRFVREDLVHNTLQPHKIAVTISTLLIVEG